MRTVRVQIHGRITIGEVVKQLADLPPKMQLIDIEDDRSAKLDWREIVLIFADPEAAPL